jgi:hypothetical protein
MPAADRSRSDARSVNLQLSLRILEREIPGITARVRSLDPSRRRQLAQAAARLAVRGARLDDNRLACALAAFRSSSVDPAITRRLELLMDELDGQAAKLRFQLDAYGDAPQHEPALAAQCGRTFTQARAVEAVIAALDPDVEAVDDALYEANAALDHSPAAIWALVEAVADGVNDPVELAAQQLTRR